jgi:tRNA (guanine37-N1)-methyltransferase
MLERSNKPRTLNPAITTHILHSLITFAIMLAAMARPIKSFGLIGCRRCSIRLPTCQRFFAIPRLSPVQTSTELNATFSEDAVLHDNKAMSNESITDSSIHAQFLLETWKDHPQLNPVVHFPTIIMNDPSQINPTLLLSEMQPFLASRLEMVDTLIQKIRLVRPANEYGKDHGATANESVKLVLLHPDVSHAELPPLVRASSRPGPVLRDTFGPNHFVVSHILSILLPTNVHPIPTAFEMVGHVAHLNLQEQHVPYRRVIGSVLLESLASIETVIVKVGQVSGPFRTYNFEVVAGRDSTWVQVIEGSLKLEFDLSKVYWSTRLTTERRRMIESVFQKGQTIADAFCGVGALCLLAAKHLNCKVLANDWNPDAIKWMKENVAANGLQSRDIQVQCGDAYDFLMDLGIRSGPLPHHVLMNFPSSAPTFLGALRWWPSDSEVVPRVHVYTFARGDLETARTCEDVAIDLVADNLVTEFGGKLFARKELDEDYRCNVSIHTVRDVAPNKGVVCVSFSATPALLKAMQGFF